MTRMIPALLVGVLIGAVAAYLYLGMPAKMADTAAEAPAEKAMEAQVDKALLKKIEARQGYYDLVSQNAGPLFAMAKGDVAYDADAARTAANNLLLLSQMNNGSLWAPGTSNEEAPGKTRALKKIWETFPAITEKLTAFNTAVAAVAAAAGNGEDALRATVGPLGGACKACHQEYRAESF